MSVLPMPGNQRITRCKGHDTTPGNLVEQHWQPFSQRARPRQPPLGRKQRDQIEVPRTSKQHFRLLDQAPQPLGNLAPPSRAEPDHLDHASDCMPAALPETYVYVDS